jgi:hypothetical protein
LGNLAGEPIDLSFHREPHDSRFHSLSRSSTEGHQAGNISPPTGSGEPQAAISLSPARNLIWEMPGFSLHLLKYLPNCNVRKMPVQYEKNIDKLNALMSNTGVHAQLYLYST